MTDFSRESKRRLPDAQAAWEFFWWGASVPMICRPTWLYLDR
jgi:hypothetical protein